MQELWFLHSAYPLMLVGICMKFHDASLYGFKVIELTRWRHKFVRDKVQREITSDFIWDFGKLPFPEHLGKYLINQSRTNGPINAHLTIAQVMPKYNHNNEKQEALL